MKKYSGGATLIETVVFLTIISLAFGTLANVYTHAILNSVDPLVRTRALEFAEAQLDEILARKFDENTPTGGVPACGSADGPTCLGISPEADFDDVGDFNGFTDSSDTYHRVSVAVVDAGAEIGLLNTQARRITVTVTVPTTGATHGKDTVVLSAYKTNF